MHFQFLSTLFIAFLATKISAELLYRSGNAATPIPAQTRLLQDFGELVEGRFIHRPNFGLSTYNALEHVQGKHIYTTTSEAADAAGFHVTEDGPPGHRSIAIREGESILEADLPERLRAIGWTHLDRLEISDVTQILLE